MKYKFGDEVLIKGKVVAVDLGKSGCPYWVGVSNGMGYWLSEADITDKTYEQGLTDAWELARKIYHAPCDGGLENSEIEEIFDCKFGSVTHKYTAEEALSKIEAYERKKEIKVGSIIETKIGKSVGVVTRLADKERAYIVWNDGTCGSCRIEDMKKTGRTADGLEGLLRQIGE